MQKIKPLNILFYLSVISLSLGQFALINRSGGVPVYLFDIVIGLYALIGLLSFLGMKKKIHLTKSQLLLLAFTFIATLSLLPRLTTLATDELVISSFYLIRWVIYFISAVITHSLIKTGELKSNSIYLIFLFSAVFVSIAGFIQLAVLPDFTVLDPLLGWDPHKNRLASVFFDPNFTGGYLVSIFGLFLGLHLYKVRKLKVSEMFIYLPIILVAILLTFSRSSWGMLAVIVLILGIFKARLLIVVSLALAFLTYFAVPRVQTRISGVTDPADSAAFRLVSWENTIDISKENLLLGVGFNAYRFAQKEQGFLEAGTLGGNADAGSDSSILLVLATTGVLGTLLFLSGFINGATTKYLLPVFMGLLIHSLFVNSLFYPQIMFLWLSLDLKL